MKGSAVLLVKTVSIPISQTRENTECTEMHIMELYKMGLTGSDPLRGIVQL